MRTICAITGHDPVLTDTAPVVWECDRCGVQDREDWTEWDEWGLVLPLRRVWWAIQEAMGWEEAE